MRFASGLIGQLGDGGNAAIDLISHCTLFLGCGGNLVGHVRDVCHRVADAGQRLIGLLYTLNPFVGLFTADFHGQHGFFGGALQLGDQLVNLPGGFGRALRQ